MSCFIFTEIFNCGKIGNIAIQSFLKHHQDIQINVIGAEKDFEMIPEHDMVNRIIMNDREIIEGFRQGHLGTSLLWAHLIKTVKEKFICHFDSDVIFRENVLSNILEYTESYDLIGPRRCYKHNPCGPDYNKVRHLPDVTQTYCFAFNRHLVSNYHLSVLSPMCRGTFNPTREPVIDFFDPVSFNILNNGGRIKILHPDDMGGQTELGKRNNAYPQFNDGDTPFKIDFGKKIVHFSAVGSGMNIHNGNTVKIPESYMTYALDRYALFCKIFYDEDIGVDLSKYQTLLDIEEWF